MTTTSELWVKTCRRCGAEGDALTLFGKRATEPDGRSRTCKPCVKSMQAEATARLSPDRRAHRDEYVAKYRVENARTKAEKAAAKYAAAPSVARRRALRAAVRAETLAATLQKAAEDQSDLDDFNAAWSEITELLKGIRTHKRKCSKPWLKKAKAERRGPKPAWVQWEDFEDVYTRASDLTAATGVTHAVDHIYPLKSDWVCGLHTPDNMQVLTLKDNGKKRGRPYGPLLDELPDPRAPEVYWPGEQVTEVQRRAAEKLLPLAGRYPIVAEALHQFYTAAAEPEHLRLAHLKGMFVERLLDKPLEDVRKSDWAPEHLRTRTGSLARPAERLRLAMARAKAPD